MHDEQGKLFCKGFVFFLNRKKGSFLEGLRSGGNWSTWHKNMSEEGLTI